MIAKFRKTAIAAALLFAAFPQVSVAEEFTGAQILAWEQEKQDSYFQISIIMASFIAAQKHPEQAKCIDKWYFEDIAAKNNRVRESIALYSDYHPSGVIIAVLKKACGDFL